MNKAMHTFNNGGVELDSYAMKDVTIMYNFSLLELREAQTDEFLSIRKNSIRVRRITYNFLY